MVNEKMQQIFENLHVDGIFLKIRSRNELAHIDGEQK